MGLGFRVLGIGFCVSGFRGLGRRACVDSLQKASPVWSLERAFGCSFETNPALIGPAEPSAASHCHGVLCHLRFGRHRGLLFLAKLCSC